MRRKTPFAILLAAVLAGLVPHAGRGAEPPETDPAALAKQYSRLQHYRFVRQASSIYDAVIRYARTDPSHLAPSDRFLRAYYEGRWDDVRKTLAALPAELSAAIYDKMLTDLTGRNVPVVTLDDFLGLADACPGDLNSDRIRKLGLLLRIAVAKEQELWLRRALEKGTQRLGGDESKRLITGRILMHGNFDDLARQYLPDVGQASQLQDAEARDEIMKFLASQEELEQFQQTRIAGLWEQDAKFLAAADLDQGQKQQAADRLAELIGKAPVASVAPWIRSLVQKDLDGALRLGTALGKRSQARLNDSDLVRRTNNLKAQKILLLAVAQRAELAKPPWSHVAAAMADWWIQEAEHTFEVRPEYRSTRPTPHVAPGELLDAAPAGGWLKALSASRRDRVDVCLSKAILVSDHYEDAVARILEIARRNPGAAVSLAEEYLQAWAHRHNPHIPEEVRKQYKLADDARIMVTPIMMEKNIADLAKMMDIFRRNGIQPRNEKLVIDAFDVCYSNAEVYRRSHIESVFGGIDEMDEDVFLQMIRSMTQGLGSRWRRMEVQQASGTGRSQAETLRMVRDGYRSAIAMIDQRSRRHPDAWRILMLAGSLLSDWGDFEYYQQLVGDANVDRTEAFREKNNLAEQYFTRAAEAYARQVPQLSRRQYSIDVYLAWFHSLLGINTSGNLNLSKPLDRRVLNKIRDLMRQLPGGAGKAHIDMLAKHVNARLEDTEHPLHEELKYKYLAGSLVITKDSPFSFQASNKVAYYDELLDEIRLETRVDGPSTIHRDHEFGIILSVYHSEAMGRMANFGKYLTNETPPANTRPTGRTSQPMLTTYKMTQAQGRRDELELNIRESLSLFFDIRSITFSPKDVRPRPTDRPGWEETILAYIHAKAKDCSVDKIPRIQMNLEFLDMTGPVAISAESAETMIRVAEEDTPPRPFDQADLTLTLDPRSMPSTEEVLLEVKATVCGLVPELEELLDFSSLDDRLPVARIEPQTGTLVRQINSWGDTVHAVSERQWTIAFDASSLVRNPRRIEFRMPAAKQQASHVAYQAYVDMDLIELDEPVAPIGSGPSLAGEPMAVASLPPWARYAAAAGALAVLLLAAAGLVRLLRGSRQRPLRARDVFHMPAEIDAFTVVQLLRALGRSELVRLSDRQHDQMRQEIQRIQASCFGGNGSELPDEHLRRVAKKWLKIAC